MIRRALCLAVLVCSAMAGSAVGELRNLGLPGDRVLAGPGMFAFFVRESGHGGRDLNGDGDSFDSVVHIYDVMSDQTVNLGLAAVRLELAGQIVSFVVDEAEQGQDLNGDGDTDDGVPHVYDRRLGILANLGRSSGRHARLAWTPQLVAFIEHGFGGPVLVYDVRDRVLRDAGFAGVRAISAAGRYVVFEFESTLRIYDVVRDATIDTGLRLSLSPLGVDRVAIAGRTAAIPVSEFAMGGVDFNGDGDFGDQVVHLLDLVDQELVNTGLAVAETRPYLPLEAVGDRFLLRVSEPDQAYLDLNGDGDVEDSVIHSLTRDGSSTNFALAILPRIDSSDSLAAFFVPESWQGQRDLNGDRDTRDSVVHVYDAALDQVVNSGLAGYWLGPLSLWRRGASFAVHEGGQGESDLNQDGDLFDRVVHVVRVEQRRGRAEAKTINTGLAVRAYRSSAISGSGRVIVVPVSETFQGSQDLDGDGRVSSSVLHAFDLAEALVRNMRYAVGDDPIGSWGHVAVPIRESVHGDLNDDGDRTDSVLHVGAMGSVVR